MVIHEVIAGLLNPLPILATRGPVVCRCLLLETRAGLVLVDTGLGLVDAKDIARLRSLPLRVMLQPELNENTTAIARVKALGYHPRDVKHILMTHLDYDHAGGLVDFPQATVHVSQVELDGAMHRKTLLEKMRYLPRQFAHQPRWMAHGSFQENWQGLRATACIPEVKDDLLLVALPGHTRGHCGVAIRQGDGWLLHAGDAMVHHGELATPANCPLGFRAMRAATRMDRQAWRASLQRVCELSEQSDLKITCAHDPAMGVL